MDTERLLKVAQEYFEHEYAPYVGGATFLAGAAAWFYATDISRAFKHTAYRLGHQQKSGNAPIPGPLEDTRIIRFIDGPRMVTEYRKKYGPLYRVFCGDIPEIVLTDPDDIRAYYHGDAKVHLKIPNIGFGEYMGRVLGQSVGVKHNEDWRRLRSHIDPHFTSQKASELLPIMVDDTDEWIESLPRLSHVVRNEKDNKLAIKAEELVSILPFKMIARRVFGELVDDKLIDELFHLNTVHERVINHTFFGKFEQWKIFKYLPVQANRDADDFERDWAALLKRTSLEAERRGMTTTVSELYKNMKEGHMTFLEFAHSIDEILFTNMDVTTTSVSWVTAQVAMNPPIMARLQKEIDDALSDESLGSNRQDRADAYIRKINTLLHYCYLESGRLHPVLFYSLPELTAEPKIIHGYYLPARTSVLIDTHTLNRDAPVWGPDGHVFRPDRFGELLPTQYRYSYWRFGLGPRKCVGINFGDKIIKTILMGIMEKYSVEVVDNYLGQDFTKFVHAPAGTMLFTPRQGRI